MADHRPEPLPRRRLLICADSGGSNGARIRAWKIELANLAEQTGLAITVCHLPPGTSKWNKIEHRLFSQGPYPRFVDTGCDYAAVASVAV